VKYLNCKLGFVSSLFESSIERLKSAIVFESFKPASRRSFIYASLHTIRLFRFVIWVLQDEREVKMDSFWFVVEERRDFKVDN
jgi:hypothetical protein